MTFAFAHGGHNRVMGVLAVLGCVAALNGCGDTVWGGDLPTPDEASFETQVYPVMLHDCAFNNTCHGNPSRFFQVYGPGRQRLDPTTTQPEDPPTQAEISVTYQRALSMLVREPSEPVTEALLLKKPLERKAGGVSHKGIDALGRNVYQSKQDPNYMVLVQWASSAGSLGSGGMGGSGAGTGGLGFGGANAGFGGGAGSGAGGFGGTP